MRHHPFIFSILAIFSLLLVLSACAAAPIATTPTAAPTTSTVTATARENTLTPTLVPVPSVTPAASPTPTDSPTPTATATPFLAPPPPGQAERIPILMYHHLALLGNNPSKTQRDWTVSPENFEAQLDYIQSLGYHTVTFAQLVAFFDKSEPLPLHPIILTFDDGWIDDYTVAFPALRRHGMIGTFFVPTVYADAGGKTLLNWDDIKEMDAAGMEFGSHTLNHANLKEASAEEALRQLQSSKVKMEQKLGHGIIALSYPFGAYNSGVLDLVQKSGYRVGVGLCCSYQIRANLLLTLPRIRISYDDTLEDFGKKLPPSEGK